MIGVSSAQGSAGLLAGSKLSLFLTGTTQLEKVPTDGSTRQPAAAQHTTAEQTPTR